MNVIRKIFRKIPYVLFLVPEIYSSCTLKEADLHIDDTAGYSTLYLNLSTVSGFSSTRTVGVEDHVTDEAEHLESVRVLVFSTDGNKVLNKRYEPDVDNQCVLKIKINPGIYDFYFIANEHKNMMQAELDGVTNKHVFLSLPCIKKARRESGMYIYKTNQDKKFRCFLMKGHKRIEIYNSPGEQYASVPLERSLAKVEVTCINQIAGGEARFNEFRLGNFPLYFSVFESIFYPLSDAADDIGRSYTASDIASDTSYIFYIPLFRYSDLSNTSGEKINFTFNWKVKGYLYTKTFPFRESDDSPDRHDIKSNYYYKYAIRLKNIPENPLTIECKILPWQKESTEKRYVSGTCNLEIQKTSENQIASLDLVLEHVEAAPDFNFEDTYVLIPEAFYYNYDVWINGEKDTGEWDGTLRVYRYRFSNDGSGKSVIQIKSSTFYPPSNLNAEYGFCYFEGMKIDLERLN